MKINLLSLKGTDNKPVIQALCLSVSQISSHLLIHLVPCWYSAINLVSSLVSKLYRGADKSLARPASRCILFDGENISFDASLVIYINSTYIPPIMIINRT
jgi:hypothetical protein